MNFQIKTLTTDAMVPERKSEQAAGYDLFTAEDYVITPGRNLVPTGIAMAIPYGWEGHIRPRSGFAAYGIKGKQTGSEVELRYDADVIQGTIDSDYRGEVKIIVISHESQTFVIPKHTRLAQIVLSPCFTNDIKVVNNLDETERGEGGFGHTGSN